jgi:uncharacterized damage-inducible protein DinB
LRRSAAKTRIGPQNLHERHRRDSNVTRGEAGVILLALQEGPMAVRRTLNLEEEIVEAFERCGRVTEYLVTVLPPPLWHGEPPTGHGRTIAAMISHVHGVRRTFAKMGGGPAMPALDRKTLTPTAANRALRATNDVLVKQFREALAAKATRVKGMPRRSVEMMSYLTQHDAHHRGQIMLRARELGHDFPTEDIMRIWGWKKLP